MLVRTAEKTSDGAGELVGGVPLFAGGGGAGEREPVVGDGEGGEEEAAEEDLFKERGEQDAEGGDEPDVGRGAEEVVHGDDLGREMREEMAWTAKDRMMPMGMRRRALRRAASRLAWMPSAKGRFQRSGKMNQETARVAR